MPASQGGLYKAKKRKPTMTGRKTRKKKKTFGELFPPKSARKAR